MSCLLHLFRCAIAAPRPCIALVSLTLHAHTRTHTRTHTHTHAHTQNFQHWLFDRKRSGDFKPACVALALITVVFTVAVCVCVRVDVCVCVYKHCNTLAHALMLPSPLCCPSESSCPLLPPYDTQY